MNLFALVSILSVCAAVVVVLVSIWLLRKIFGNFSPKPYIRVIERTQKLRSDIAAGANPKPLTRKMRKQPLLGVDRPIQLYRLNGIVFAGPPGELWHKVHPHDRITYVRIHEAHGWEWFGISCQIENPGDIWFSTAEWENIIGSSEDWTDFLVKGDNEKRVFSPLAVMSAGEKGRSQHISEMENNIFSNVGELINLLRLVRDSEMTPYDLHNLYYHPELFQSELKSEAYADMPLEWVKKLEGIPMDGNGVFEAVRSHIFWQITKEAVTKEFDTGEMTKK